MTVHLLISIIEQHFAYVNRDEYIPGASVFKRLEIVQVCRSINEAMHPIVMCGLIDVHVRCHH